MLSVSKFRFAQGGLIPILFPNMKYFDPKMGYHALYKDYLIQKTNIPIIQALKKYYIYYFSDIL